MTEEQKEAYGKFALSASKKGVTVGVILAVASVMFENNDWRSTLNDISALLVNSHNATEFERDFFVNYPGQEVAQEPIDD